MPAINSRSERGSVQLAELSLLVAAVRGPPKPPAKRSNGAVWHDGIGMSLYAKRLERGRFVWPSPADGIVAISPAQLAYMLDGIDWRNPVRTWRPEAAG
jgi:transposase